MSRVAALLAVVIFLIAAAVGLALVSAVERRPSAGLVLQAPALGFAVVVIVAASLNRVGWPVISFAWPLTIVAVVVSLLILACTRRIDLRSYAPFVAIVMVTILLIGWPIFQFGFGWISFANGDMVNYCMEAERFVHHGWDQAPSVSSLASFSDPSQYYWIFNVLIGERYASSELLAVVIAVSGHPGFQIFMPTMLALTAALSFAVCGLVYRSEKYRGAALLTGALLGVNALFALGTLAQLLDQVLGLMFLCATVALIWRLSDTKDRAIEAAIIPSVALAGLCYAYPECLPFAIGACVCAALRAAIIGKFRYTRVRAQVFGACLVMTALLVNRYLVTDLVVFRIRAFKSVATLLFPYYLIPTGIGNIAGVIPQGTFPGEASSNVLIIVGATFIVFGIVGIAMGCRDGEPIAYVAALMGIGIVAFLAMRSSFTLFKLAMFIQPFATGCLALLVLRKSRSGHSVENGLA